jgi:hypothetical protein
MAKLGKKLLVHRINLDEIVIYDLNTLAVQNTLTGIHGAYSIVTDPSGWVAYGAAMGNELHAFHIDNPDVNYTVHISPEDGYAVSGLDIHADDPSNPEVWVGSAGNRQFLHWDIKSGEVRVVLPLISGLFFPQVVQSGNSQLLISGNSLILGGLTDLPFIYDLTNQQTLVGDPSFLGVDSTHPDSKTKLVREYLGHAVVDSETDSIFYFNANRKLMRRFLLSAPSESVFEDIPLNVTLGLSMKRYGKCLIVQGSTPDAHLRPQWTILAQGKDKQFTALRTTDYSTDLTIRNTVWQEFDDAGNLVITHQRGMSRVEGLLTGLDCK